MSLIPGLLVTFASFWVAILFFSIHCITKVSRCINCIDFSIYDYSSSSWRMNLHAICGWLRRRGIRPQTSPQYKLILTIRRLYTRIVQRMKVHSTPPADPFIPYGASENDSRAKQHLHWMLRISQGCVRIGLRSRLDYPVSFLFSMPLLAFAFTTKHDARRLKPHFVATRPQQTILMTKLTIPLQFLVHRKSVYSLSYFTK